MLHWFDGRMWRWGTLSMYIADKYPIWAGCKNWEEVYERVLVWEKDL